MKVQLLDHIDGRRTFVAVMEDGDEPVTALAFLAKREGLSGAHFTGIGAFSSVTLGFYDRARRDYSMIPITGPLEVVSLVGNIARGREGPQVHAHVVVAKADGVALGGHLLKARVTPTLEIMLEESPQRLWRKLDEATGLALIDLDGH